MVMFIAFLVIAIILAILFCPIYLKIEFYETLSINLKILFYWIKIFPIRNEKIEESENNKINDNKDPIQGKNKKDNKVKKLLNQMGLKGFLNILSELGKILLRAGKKLKSKVKVDNLDVLVDVADEDSAKTAVRYGKACACIFPFANLILKYFKIKDYSVKVYPNFMNDKSRVKFSLKFHFNLISLIYIVLWAFAGFIKVFYLKPQISKK